MNEFQQLATTQEQFKSMCVQVIPSYIYFSHQELFLHVIKSVLTLLAALSCSKSILKQTLRAKTEGMGVVAEGVLCLAVRRALRSSHDTIVFCRSTSEA